MRLRSKKSCGFTLIELLVAMALSLLVFGAGLTLFKQGNDVATVVSARSQMQQDLRASENLIIRDISLAGAGLPNGGVGLPVGGGPNPKYGCDQTATCYVPFVGAGTANGINVPNRQLTYIIPGPGLGPKLNGTQPNSDVVTVVYADSAFALDQYNVSFNANATQVTFTAPAPLPAPPPQTVDDPSVGLVAGDLVFFQDGAGKAAIGEVTGAVNRVNATTFTVPFLNGDVLAFNQPGTAGDLDDFVGSGSPVQARRISVITYFLSTWTDGTGNVIPRLMRQVNGQPAVPVAENIVDFRLSYDTYDANGNLLVNSKDAGGSVGVSPNMIRKVNLQHLTARKQLPRTLGFETIDLQTEISARNMSFKDRYQ